MSMEALLVAVRNRLRTALTLADALCDVQHDGSVPPSAGEVYYSVHPAGISNDDTGAHRLDETYDVKVTVTMKVGWLPRDRYGTQSVAKASTGLYARAEAARAALHMDYTSMNAANTTIGVADNGFVEPLKFRSCSAVAVKGPDWFGADDQANPPSGLAVELSFVGARRVQVIEEQG